MAFLRLYFYIMQEKIREALSQFDENEDGKISFEEFRSWWDCEEVK